MILEMGLDWMRLPWVAAVDIIIGRMRSNAAQEDLRESKGFEVGESTAARERLNEWLSEAAKSPEDIQREEDDALLTVFGLVRPETEEVLIDD